MLRQATGLHRDQRVSICVPCRDLVHAAFAYDLAKLLQHCQSVGIEVEPHFCMGTLIVNQREQLVDMAHAAGSTHVLWLDSDMMFPPDTLQRLLAHDVGIVAGNYVTRQYPHKTVAYKRLMDWKSYVVHDGTEDLIAVEAVGMGCMLVDMTITEQMARPRFQTSWIEDSRDHMGEDFYFCSRARELGHTIWIDDKLSMDLQHLGTVAFNHGMVRKGLL